MKRTDMPPVNGPRSRGQTAPYFLTMAVILAMCWAMMVNIAKLLKDRMMMQNAADNAALSVAVFRARTLNLLGASNYLMAAALSSSAYPCMVPVPMFNTGYVGGSVSSIPFPFCDKRRSKTSGFDTGVEHAGVNRLRYTVNTIHNFQKLLVLNYTANSILIAQTIGQRQEKNSRGKNTGADITIPIPAEMAGSLDSHSISSSSQLQLKETLMNVSPEKSLGIRKNTKTITYYKTINIQIDFPRRHHIVLPKKWMSEETGWYTATDDFYRQKVVVLSMKNMDSESNRGYPLLKGFFRDTAWPPAVTVAAAAVYNAKGKMFPGRCDAVTGIPGFLRAPLIASQARQIKELYDLAEDLQKLPYIGQALGMSVMAAIAYTGTISMQSLLAALNDPEAPSGQYETAESHGWDAHLVPVDVFPVNH